MDDPCMGYSLVNLCTGGRPAMPQKKYLVTLNDEDREQLEQLLHRGTHATRQAATSGPAKCRAPVYSSKRLRAGKTVLSLLPSQSGAPRSNASANASSKR